jgi:hypothetical protein
MKLFVNEESGKNMNYYLFLAKYNRVIVFKL